MKTFFAILFFKFFQFSKSIGNVDDGSYAFKSVAILSLFLSLNFFTVVAYFKCWILHSNNLQLSIIFEVLTTLVIGSFVYFIFYKDERYNAIFEKIVERSGLKNGKGTMLTIFYIVGSIALFASVIWLDCKN